MPRIVTVSEVRNQLYWAAGGPSSAGTGARSIALLGSLFHTVFSDLTGGDRTRNLVGPLSLADASLESWQDTLIAHAYSRLVAPGLATNQAALQGDTSEVLSFWTAVQELCRWLAEIFFELRGDGASTETLRNRLFFSHEVELQTEFADRSSADRVIVQGRADSILRHPKSGDLCLVELKLGRTAPEADLLQACLYHLMMRRANGATGGSARLALISFEPQRHELIFDADRLLDAQAKLIQLLQTIAPLPGPPVPAPKPQQELWKKIEDAFAEFGAPLDLDRPPTLGPAFIRFLGTPRRGVKARALASLSDSIWTRLHTAQPPHIAMERGRVTIDVERPDRQQVLFADWTHTLPPRTKAGVSRFPVGISVDGTPRFADLASPECAHFLVAGTSGSGKSEWLRATIACLLYSNPRITLQLALIDPKRTAFASLGSSPYLCQPLAYSEEALKVLDALVEEMERRYGILSKAGVSDLRQYNEQGTEPIPRIVCVCDEYADLVLGDRKRRQAVETAVARLGAKARAAGIHLIFATQRPSRDIVKGVIDANLTARVALKVVRPLDSRLILDDPGAATLLGRGDLLYKDVGNPIRLQGIVVDQPQLDRLALART